MRNRIINGYICLYDPNSKYCFSKGKHAGFVYEHIHVLEQEGIIIPPGFEVHHLDGNRQNNDINNLIVLSKQDHTKLHNWLRACDLNLKELSANRVNSGKPKNRFCIHCQKKLVKSQMTYCSQKCMREHKKSVIPCEDLLSLPISELKERYFKSEQYLRKLKRQCQKSIHGNPEPSS